MVGYRRIVHGVWLSGGGFRRAAAGLWGAHVVPTPRHGPAANRNRVIRAGPDEPDYRSPQPDRGGADELPAAVLVSDQQVDSQTKPEYGRRAAGILQWRSMIGNSELKVAWHWFSMGPYHFARIAAVARI